MSFLKKIIFFSLLAPAVFLSCRSKSVESLSQPADSGIHLPAVELAGRLLTFAPDMDITTCEAMGECDCCSGHFAFINENDVVMIVYCEADRTYHRGSYQINGPAVSVRLDGLTLERVFNWESETGTDTTHQYTITEKKASGHSITLNLLNCEKNLAFECSEPEMRFATLRKDFSFDDVIKEMKEGGIWHKLGF